MSNDIGSYANPHKSIICGLGAPGALGELDAPNAPAESNTQASVILTVTPSGPRLQIGTFVQAIDNV